MSVFTLSLWLLYWKDIKHRKQLIGIPVIYSTITLSISLIPIYYLSQNNEFKFGVQNIWESFKGLVAGSIRSNKYLGNYTVEILTILFLVILIGALFYSFKKKKAVFFSLNLCLLIIMLHLIYYLLGFYFPSERKTTIYIPLLAVFFAVLLSESKLSRPFNIITGTICLLWTLNFIKVLSFRDTVEWYYERDTKKRVLSLNKNATSKITIFAHWHFHPTTEYYRQTKSLDKIDLLPYNKNMDLSQNPDMVIGYKSDMGKFPNYKTNEPKEPIALYYRIK